MVEIILTFVFCAASFIGGFFIGQNNTQIQHVDNKTTVETRQDTRQTSVQGQFTFIFNQEGQKTEYLSINVNDITNIEVNRSTNSNTIVVTNRSR